MFGRVSTELAETFGVPPDSGRVTTEIVERFDVPPASGRISTGFAEHFSVPAGRGRVTTVLTEVFVVLPTVTVPAYWGVWPQELLAVTPDVQGQRLKRRRGQM